MSLPEVLLIGGMGYVGRNLQEALLKAGYTIHVLDRRDPEKEKKGKITFYKSSLSDEPVLKALLSRCAIVFYLASDSVPTTTARTPSREGELNLIPFLKYLDLFQEFNHIHMVYLSSGGTVYGNPEIVPVQESMPIAPISYHGAGKATMEAFLHAGASQCGNRITVLRPSNLYGPGQPYIPGFGLIRSILEKMRRHQPVEIWGDGEIIRDYLFIDDFVSACLACIQQSDAARKFRIYNVSSGQSLSIRQLCDLIESVIGKALNRTYLSGRAIDVKSVILDYSKIKNELNWQPGFEIQEGIRLTWQWVQSLPL